MTNAKPPATILLEGEPGHSGGEPISLGVPFARGVLSDPAHLSLRDARGRVVSLQSSPLARWSDGSLKWLLLDFIAGPLAGPREAWELCVGDGGGAASVAPASLVIAEDAESLTVETGAATFRLARTAFPPLVGVTLGDRAALEPGSVGVTLTDPKGRQGRPRVTRFEVESRGPVRATVRAEGYFTGRVPLRFVGRLDLFAGTGLVRVKLTIHNPERARHRGGLWDLGDRGSRLFRDLSLVLGVAGAGEPRAEWVAEINQPPRTADRAALEIYQDSSGGANWRGSNHVNRHGRAACTFRGYRVRVDDREESGRRASPVVRVGRGGVAVTAAVPGFWQQFPKAVEVEGATLRARLFPGQFADLHELQGGERTTQSIWLDFSPGDPTTPLPLTWAHQPLRARSCPEWYEATNALPRWRPFEPSGRGDAYLSEAVDRLLAGRETIDEYGWRNFGDVYADHEAEYHQGPTTLVSHYNNQYDLLNGSLLQYLRTGNPRWAEVFEPLARHVMDIDVYHTDRDRPAYNGGLFWFTDHFKDAATCTHRTYSRKNVSKKGSPYGGGPSSNHLFTTGLLHYHYLTGDPDARDAVVGLAEWVLAMDDGRKTVLGWIDSDPTGLASMSGTADYHGPGRGAGNSVNALLDAWSLTGESRYLDYAEALIRRCVHPDDDVAARDLLNVEARWSYTVFLTTLARYLDLKAEAGQLDTAYAYARASLLHYADWMAEHERPYFDQVEKLHYPTAAWAGQEFRKANVLPLAAAHADEPLRSRLRERGKEFHERAWSDLLRFETRYSARAVALAAGEAFLDPAAQPAKAMTQAPRDFGRPQRFLSQKRRVVTLQSIRMRLP